MEKIQNNCKFNLPTTENGGEKLLEELCKLPENEDRIINC